MSNFFSKLTSTVSVVTLVAASTSTSLVAAASEFLPYAEALADNGVITAQSTEAGYRLGDTVTRAELAKVTANLGGITPTECAGDVFSDVGTSLGDLCGYVEALAEAGVVSTSSATYRPKANVTRAEMVKMLLAALGETPSDVDAGYMDLDGLGDLAGYVNRANEIGCASDATYFRPNATASRGESFKIAACVAQIDVGGEEPPVVNPPVTPGTGSTNTGVVAPVGGDLSVALAGTAMAQFVPKNAAAINVGTLKLTAGSADVAVSSITVGRSGLGAKADIGKIYASINGAVNNNNSYNSSSEEGVIFFSPALVVKAGTSTEVQVLVSLVSTAQSNSQHQFAVKSVASNSSSATGTPVTLGLISTTSAEVAGVTVATAGSNSTYRVGDKSVEVAQFKVTNSATEDKNVKMNYITLRNNGTGDMSKNLSNIGLYVNGVKVSTSTSIDSKNLTIALSDTILFGRTNTYSLRADINGVDNASGDTYNFAVRNTTDVSATESGNNFGVNVTLASSTFAVYTVSGGDVVLTRDASVAATATVAQGTNDVVLAAGTLSIAAPINLESFTLVMNRNGVAPTAGQMNATFSSLKLVIDGVTVATATPSVTDTTTVSFGGKYSVSKSSTIRVLGNVRSTATTGVVWKALDLDQADFGVKEYVSNGNSIPSGSFIGSVAGVSVTVGNAQITFTRNDGVSSQSVVSGAQNLLLGRYNVTATDTSDVKISQLKFTNAASLTSNANLTSVKLVVGGTVVSSKSFSAGNADFNGLSITVPKNGSVQIEVRGDFDTAVTGTFSLALADNNTTAQDANSTTLANTDVLEPSVGATYTFVTSGSAALSKNSGSPSAAIVTAGSTVEVARVGFSAQFDDVTLRDLYLANTGAANLSEVVSSISLQDEAGVVLANGTIVGKTVKFSLPSNAFSVAKNTSSRFAKVVVTIGADSVTDSTLTNESLSLVTGINGSDFTPVAGTVNGVHFVSQATGNDVATVTSATGTSVSNSHLVTRSSVVVAAPATGDFSRHSFTVTAGTSNKVKLSSFTLNTNNTATGIVATIYKDSVTTGNNVATGTFVNGVITFSTPVEISAGTTKTFYVDLAGVTSSTNGTSIRTFKITDVAFYDIMNTGTLEVLIPSVSAYNNVGIPTTEQKATY